MTWIRTNRVFPLPDYVKEALHLLHQNGYIAYIVGGSVRDFVLHRPSKDHDIATSATPDQVCKLFPNCVTVGKSFGVIKVPIFLKNNSEETTHKKELFLEISTFREDLDYVDHRHPKGVSFSTPEKDALRRDFTINSLFYDFKNQQILDTVGGLQDLQLKKIKAIGDPEKRFQEDALRLMRAIRFSCALRFDIEENTYKAILKKAPLIKKISGERIRDELSLMIHGERVTSAIETLSHTGILSHIFPELEALKGLPESPLDHPDKDVWSHTLEVCDTMEKLYPQRNTVFSWSVLFHEVGKSLIYKKNNGANYNGHEQATVELLDKILNRIHLSKKEINNIKSLILSIPKFRDAFQMRESTLTRWVLEPLFEEKLKLEHVISVATDGNLSAYDFCFSFYENLKKRKESSTFSLLTGEDLIQLGFQPGPLFSTILKTVEDQFIERKLLTKEEALDFIVKHYVK